MEEIDIWRSAQQIIKTFGDEAIDWTVKRANQLMDQGDGFGAHVMVRVAEAIEVLQRPDSEGQRLH